MFSNSCKSSGESNSMHNRCAKHWRRKFSSRNIQQKNFLNKSNDLHFLLFTNLRNNLLLTRSIMIQKCSLKSVGCECGWNLQKKCAPFIDDSGGEIWCNIHSSFLSFDADAYLGLSSSILLMKSGFSRHPSQFSSQSLRIFLRSLTLSFFRSTVLRSICLSEKGDFE